MAGSAKGLVNVPKVWSNAGGLRQVGGARGLARAYGTNAKTAALELRQATIQTLRHPATKLKNAAKALRHNHWTTPSRRAKDRLKELVAKSEYWKDVRRDARAQLEEILPKGFTLADCTAENIENTMREMIESGIDDALRKKIRNLSYRSIDSWIMVRDLGEEIGEVGGLAHLEEQGVRVVDSFLMPGPGKMRLDAIGLSRDGKALIVAEFKGLTARLSRNPCPTQFEGLAKQGTAPYTRDRMLTDPRVAQYLADTPRVWDSVTSGQMQYQL
ncbi:hypothetical protein [Buchananella hordeovulneris]|uniref:hypothetical protein n=1 Tax=Buchananella hordeovulneris TaxID=52770 RepID=UPI0026DD50DD|nr:hypothetical protein [Buchananella hordeovulneris]MDO5079894.1 hypothetical protein [Buchananella hordeovulneris]